MKKHLFILVAFVVFCGNVQSQAPQRFNYQVIARDADGNPLLNQSVNFRISILQGSAAGTAVYIETHALTTNDFGMATMAIGAGAVVTGVFSSISWGTDSHYVRTEVDPTGGTSFTFAGVTQLLSVPYALYANSSGSGGTTYTAGLGINITGSTITNTEPNAIHWGDAIGGNELSVVRIQGRDVLATPPTNGQVLTWNGDYNAWEPSNAGSMVPGTSGQTLRNDGMDWVASNLLYNDGTNIGIGTTTPSALLHIEGIGAGKGNVLFRGDYEHTGFGSAPIEGAGTRMMWYPDKSAFRAGTVNGTQWNTVNIGGNSVALGSNNIASGWNSTAFGYENNATGAYSTAFGYYNNATGAYSTAMGAFTTSSGDWSSSTGYRSFAIGDYSLASGYQSLANGIASNASGYFTYASGDNSTTMGYNTIARSFAETVIGCYNSLYWPEGGTSAFYPTDRLFVIANGENSVARSNAMTVLKNGNTGLGTDTPQAQLHTTGTIRFAGAGTPGSGKVLTSDELGNATWQTLSGGGSLPSGTYGQTLRHDGSAWVGNSLLFNDNTNIGIGTATPTALLHIEGTGSGKGNILFNGDSDELGFGPAPIEGAGTRMMWYPDKAAFRAGSIEGSQWNTSNIGQNSVALGANTIAKGVSSTALGRETFATGNYSTAMGILTTAAGHYSSAMGYRTWAFGENSFSFGYESMAQGDASIAFGFKSWAIGNYSTAMGPESVAQGDYSIALGEFSLTKSRSEIAIGCFNTNYTPVGGTTGTFHPLDRLFVIGNGTSILDRNNALTMLKNGNTGLGTDVPQAQLHTTGTIRFAGAGTPGSGKVLTSDELGNATWQTLSGGGSLPSGTSGQTLRHDGSAWVGNSLLYNDNSNIGVGTTSPSALLHVNGMGMGNGNVVFTGDSEDIVFGPVPASGAGTRMMWYPDKAAFRAGKVNGTEWDTDNIGIGSVALGLATQATNYSTTALGSFSIASGAGATAIGEVTLASGQHSFALGYASNATETYSYAFGNQAMATGERSLALGNHSTASETGSVAIGTHAYASRYLSKSFGFECYANGNYSLAMGNSITAPSNFETVIGCYNTNYVPIGDYYAFNPLDRLFVIGNGTGSSARSNALTMLKNGNTGLGTDFPEAQLHTTGSLRFEGAGTPGAGKVLTSDEMGNATWQPGSGSSSLPDGYAGQTLRHDGTSWVANSMLFNNSSSIGIGTSAPTAQLHTKGSVRFEGAGAPGVGKVLTSDALGNATWQTISGGSLPSGIMGQTLYHDGSTWLANSLLYNNSFSIGIGTTAPTAQFHTKGSVRFEGAGAPGAGKVLTSDALGNATWQSVSGSSLPSGTTGQTLRYDGSAWVANSLLYNSSTNIGIGTTSPVAQLHTTGSVRLEGAGTPGEGKVLTSDASGNATWRGYSVGDYAQGGIIFWLDETGQHGLVACKFDQSPFSKWYAGTYGATRATGDGPLSGELNTGIIISSHVAIGDDGSLYAARICADVKLGEGPKTYGDWYLPTLNELWEMYMNRDLINSVAIAHGGNALSGEYWSSTEVDSSKVWKLSFSGGAYLQSDKAEQNRVRAIRAF